MECFGPRCTRPKAHGGGRPPGLPWRCIGPCCARPKALRTVELARNFRERSGQVVDVLFRAERTGADSDGSLREGPQGPVNVRSAVQTRTHGHVECLVQDAAQLRRRQRLAAKAQRADSPSHVAVAEDLEAVHLIEPAPEPFGQTYLMLVDL